MDPAYIGAIAEVIAAAAVVISLIYVARQVRESTRQARLGSMQALYAQMQAAGSLTASDKDIARIFIDGLEGGMASLEKYEAVQFGQLSTHVFKAYEEAYHYMKEGVIEEPRLHGFERSLLGVVTQRGFKDWWTNYRALFDPDFQAYLDSRIRGLDPDLDLRGFTDKLGLNDPEAQQE